MSHLDEMMYKIINEKCPLDALKDDITKLEINDTNIEKIQQIESLIEIHEETSRRLRHIIRLKTSKYYRKILLNNAPTNAIR